MNDRFQVCAPLTDDEREALRADIQANGVRDPIEIDEESSILDGHNRKEIADELGIACPFKVIYGLKTDEEKRDYARKRNCLRRQMTVEDKKAIARQMLEENRTRSSLSISKTTGLAVTTIIRFRDAEGFSSKSDESDEELPPEPEEPQHEWMRTAGWETWHQMEAFSHLTKLSDEEKLVLDEVLNGRARHPKDALGMLERCADWGERDRKRMVELWSTGDESRRSLVRSKLAGTMPAPDPRWSVALEVLHSVSRLEEMMNGANPESIATLRRVRAELKQLADAMHGTTEEW